MLLLIKIDPVISNFRHDDEEGGHKKHKKNKKEKKHSLSPQPELQKLKKKDKGSDDRIGDFMR